ncbi:hypothetical protein [Enterococcus sp. DIV0756]|uniref:hypothetical protein n=1 Tax=Enterococcus sp. DIV0756 TaxID=2774636 RepID=UPI003F24E01D
MIIIRHAWLNLKRNRNSHFKNGGFIFLIVLIIFSALHSYHAASDGLSNYREQSATVLKGVQDLNQTEQAKNLNVTDYEKLKNLPYVKSSQLTAQGAIFSNLAQPATSTQIEENYTDSSDGPMKGNYLSLLLLDNDSLKSFLERKSEKLQGKLPFEPNTCVISREFAKANKLKINDMISLGPKETEQKLKIVGIADLSNEGGYFLPSSLLMGMETGMALQKNIIQTNSSVMFQLSDKREMKNFVKNFKESETFKNYSLIGRGWSEGILQSFEDRLALLFNGLIVILILGMALIILIFQQAIKKRKDFYTLYLMGMDQRTLSLSVSLENSLSTVAAAGIAVIFSQRVSSWITGEWLMKFHHDLVEQEPSVVWKLPELSQESSRFSSVFTSIGWLFLAACVLVLLLLINFRVSKIVREPLRGEY